MTLELRAVVMFYSALLGAPLPALALKQDLICFNLCRAERTLTIGTLYIRLKLNFVSIHVPVERQHCTQIESFAFSHIKVCVLKDLRSALLMLYGYL